MLGVNSGDKGSDLRSVSQQGDTTWRFWSDGPAEYGPILMSVANIIDVKFADSDQLIRGFGDNHHQLE